MVDGKEKIQILHLLGKNSSVELALSDSMLRQGVDAVVKEFEKNMHLAWAAADLPFVEQEHPRLGSK